MSNPWDIPAAPATGDADASITYAAVGRALSAWERLELDLIMLYAGLLKQRPLDARRNPKYLEANVFRTRMAEVERAARCYFILHPDQALEGDFRTASNLVTNLSSRRHEIAHGIVTPLHRWEGTSEGLDQALRKMMYLLGPPTYRQKWFDEDGLTPEFLYSSVEIDQITRQFELARQPVLGLVAVTWQQAYR
ncbi:MAG: hypothetical protein EBT89_12050 [Opitutaceae bacterium]|nr:hypothetical protein [Opitutaceae bacterium]